MQVIDLSKPIRFNSGDPFFMRVRVKHKPHWMAKALVRLLGLPFIAVMLVCLVVVIWQPWIAMYFVTGKF